MKDIKPGYTRVSTIISSVPTYANGIFSFPMQQIDQEMLARKAQLGSNVHSAIDHHIKGDFYPLNESEQGYYDSYVKWAGKTKLMAIETEMRLYEESMKITGCIDMMGKIQGSDEWCIIDFKCTVAEDAKKWPLQASFYAFLLSQNRFGMPKTALFVRLDKNGDLPTVYEYKLTQELQVAVISTYNVYKYVTGK